jgi:hypothetical protein
MAHTVSEWETQWEEFLRSIGNLIETKVAIDPTKGRFSPIAGQVIGDLTSSGTLVGYAMQLFDDPNHPILESALYSELTTISAGNQSAARGRNLGAIEKAFEDSETGKKKEYRGPHWVHVA